ncbi:MAG: hypothetical protein AAF492_07475 [Verrucomicrobiota bacterium]
MKTRMTFRVAEELADALRELPNQTHFVESVLRDALGLTCPVCGGEGRIPTTPVRLPNFKSAALPSLDRETALQLRALVRLARQLAATNIDLLNNRDGGGLGFAVRRQNHVLMVGEVDGSSTRFNLHGSESA